MAKVAIIGSGISGISAAYYLLKQGYEVDIIESSSDIGGRIGSFKLGNRWIDFGGKNIGYGYKLFREFVADQGSFNYEYFGVNTSKVVNGKIVPINREKNLRSLFNILKLANPIDLIKIFYLVKRIKKNPSEGFLNHPFYNKISDKLDHKPLSSYFSKKCCENLIRAMTVRMNGAEPNECFVGNFGSNLKIAFDKYDQIQEGMHSVIEAFVSKINVKFNSRATDVIIENNEVKGIKIINKDNQEESLFYDKVVISTPSYAASNILKSSFPEICQYLDNIRYNPVTIMVTEYKKPVFNSEVRAMVFDKSSPLSNAGAYGINDLNLVRYTFSGEAARKIIDQNISGSDLLKIAEKLMPDEFNIQNNEVVDSVHRYFKNGLCSYSAYHHRNLEQIKNSLSTIKGLILTGDYFCGASIESCFQSSKQATKYSV
jgi:oxygen-dependent protoporphyrinogen oxidase